MGDLVEIIHVDGCNDPAFLYSKFHLRSNLPISVDHLVWPDGEPAMYGDPLICYSCGQPINVAIKKENELAMAYTRLNYVTTICFHSNFQPIN